MELVRPSARYEVSYLEAERELAGERATRTTPQAFADLLAAHAAQSAVIELWLVDGDEYVGKLQLRAHPEAYQGHIGIEVRPSWRRRGLATKMLELARPHVIELDRVVVTCAETNQIVQRMIAHAGGVLIDRVNDQAERPMLRYELRNRYSGTLRASLFVGGIMANPKWWNEEHESTWTRVKAAMKRDWEQTKADVSSKGRDMDQDVDDTVKQMAGKQPIPPVGARTIENDDFDRDEDAYRYGVGARKHYGSAYPQWDDRVEGKMKEEWNDLKSGRTWDEVKAAVRRGWDRVTK